MRAIEITDHPTQHQRRDRPIGIVERRGRGVQRRDVLLVLASAGGCQRRMPGPCTGVGRLGMTAFGLTGVIAIEGLGKRAHPREDRVTPLPQIDLAVLDGEFQPGFAAPLGNHVLVVRCQLRRVGLVQRAVAQQAGQQEGVHEA